MNLTMFFRLRKPEGTDPVDVKDLNDNFDVIDAELEKRLEKTGNGSDLVTTFSRAGNRANLTSGEKISLSFGKIMKWFADLKTVAFSGSYNDLANKPAIPGGAAANYAVADNDVTNNSGYLVTARVAYDHGREIDQLNGSLNSFRSSFQAGLSSIAAAITSMGVATPGNASPDAMAANIRAIKNGASGSFVAGPSGTISTAYCGFRPSQFAVLTANTDRKSIYLYDARVGLYFAYGNQSSTLNCKQYTITDTGFTIETGETSVWANQTLYWFAYK